MACTRPPLPGGGCAYRGARMALEPIADAAHLAHAPATCSGFSWAMRPTHSSAAALHRTSFSTDLGELEVIRGGETKLAAAVTALCDRYDPAGIFVYQTCVPAMTGDDVGGLCKSLSARYRRPIVPVDLPGFAGDRDFGSRAAGDVLLNHLIGTREPLIRTTADVALVGEANVAGEMTVLRPLLAEAGIRLLASIPGDGKVAEIAGAHRARLVVSLCSQSLGGLADKMGARFGLPVLQASFHGMANTAASLRAIAAHLAVPGLSRQVEAAIRRHEAETRQRLAPLLPALAGRRALLLTGGIKAWAMATALGELGLEVVATVVQKTSVEERRCAHAVLGNDRVWTGIDEQRVAEAQADVVLSGDGYRASALKAGRPWVEINHFRPMALCGYQGAVNLARRIHTALSHPIRLDRKREEAA